MGIRLPLKTVLSYDDAGQTGATSVAGGVAKTFVIPQDTDNVVVKLTASVIAGAVSATVQTTDDGGTTWYDVARTSIVSNANNTTAEWLSIPVVGVGAGNVSTSVVSAGSVVSFGTTTGAAAASTIGQKSYNGLPILSQQGRVFLRYTAAVSSTDKALVEVKVNSQSATA
jgi:hypothetical protein